ncbi:TatD family hydrolase [Pueribacillus sp. YX66]|uniref:TatD family hydrolase n=1 Tax=Pueribacillus sp. YX66 TaxID=3229242 RepID=UPI00358D4EDF
MIDTHIHLDQYPREQMPKLIATWQFQGIKGVVAVATDVRSSYNILELSEQFSNFVFPCIGWHPEQRLPTDQEMLELLQLIKKEKNRIVGIGEIGLPYYALTQLGASSLHRYIELFTTFVKIAKEYGLPVNLHAVYEQVDIVYDILIRENVIKAQFHWLKADITMIKKLLTKGYYVSITPEVCYRERDIPLISNVPMEQLLVETDGPWKFAGPFEGRWTTPLFINESLRKISKLKNLSFENVKQQVYMNSVMLYDRITTIRGE